ncbi:MAG: beta-galactosidase trimerization domain-containing protein, partial [Ruminococcus flavefaciens]|nr:beta-galactosidase trimerization domain-containing protein [Ruminococcus flavefaciens]
GMTYDQFTDAVNVGLKFKNPLQSTQSINSDDVLSDVSSINTVGKISYTVKYWMELLKPSTAETLAYYEHPHWGKYSAITYNKYGKGAAAYLGCYFDDKILKCVLRFLCSEAGVEIPDVGYPVIIKRGVNDLGKEIVYYFNYSDDAQTVVYHGKEAVVLISGNDCCAAEGEDGIRNYGSVSDGENGKRNYSSVSDGDRLVIGGWEFVVLESVGTV